MILASWREIPPSDGLPFTEVLSETWTRMFGNINALYEGVTDEIAPQAHTRVYDGHDHGYWGGAPITHGAVASVGCYGVTPLIYFSPTTPNQIQKWTVGLVARNFGVEGGKGCEFEAAILCIATGGDFTFRWGNIVQREAYGIPVGRDGEIPAWRYFKLPAVLHPTMLDLTITLEAPAEIDSTGTSVRIYQIVIMETSTTHPAQGVAQPPHLLTAVNSASVSHFSDMEDNLVAAIEWLDADALYRLEGSHNAVFECITDRARMGTVAASQRIRGHDHNHKGKPVGMGFQVQSGWDVNTGKNPVFTADLPVAGTWYFVDRNSPVTRMAGVAGGVVTDGLLQVPVAGGITTGAGVRPYLLGMVQIYNATGTVEGCFVNVTTGTRSSVKLLGNSNLVNLIGWQNIFDDIPCLGGTWNNIGFELRGSIDAMQVDCYFIWVGEPAMYNDVPQATAVQAGTHRLG